MSSIQGTSNKDRRRLLPWVLLALSGIVLMLLLALGTWQVQRLQWKQDLIERVQARAYGTVVNAPDNWAQVSQDNTEYLRVFAEGTYLYSHQQFTYALTQAGAGYWVMTPLQTRDGKIIYINRGFIETAQRAAFAAAPAPASTPVIVTGLVRMTEPHGAIMRDNIPAEEKWYSRDVHALAAQAGLENVAPYFIDAEKSADKNALPQGGMTQLVFPNSHLVYALTWYGMAALLLGLLIYVYRRDKHSPSA